MKPGSSNSKNKGIPIPEYFMKQSAGKLKKHTLKEISDHKETACSDISEEKERMIEYIESQTTPSIRDASNIRNFNSEYEYKNELIEEARKFIQENTFNDFLLEISQDIIGQKNLELVLAGVYSYIDSIAKKGKPPKINILLTSPSGTGKTETYRALKKYFMKKIPALVISHVDVTHITTEGFKGNDTNYIVLDLIVKNTGGYGIVFMDEFDKRITPQYSSGGNDMGMEVQNQILSLIEGCVEIYSNKEINKTATIDSNLTMFIGCGSFNSVREKKKQKANKKMGFIKQGGADYDIYEHITREDIIEAGCSHEMLGRFSLIVNYHKLDIYAIKKIIKKIIDNIKSNLGFSEIIIDDEYMQELIDMSNGEYGCRMLYHSIFESTMNAYKEILKQEMLKPIVLHLKRNSFYIDETSEKRPEHYEF